MRLGLSLVLCSLTSSLLVLSQLHAEPARGANAPAKAAPAKKAPVKAEPPPEPTPEQDYAAALRLLHVSAGAHYWVQGQHFLVLPQKQLLLVSNGYASVKGYAGPSVLAIVLDARGIVKKALLVRSPDTPAYYNRVTAKLGGLEGQAVAGPDRPVLAVTGATKSSKAFAETVAKTLEAFAPLFARLEFTATGLRLDGKPLQAEGKLQARP